MQTVESVVVCRFGQNSKCPVKPWYGRCNAVVDYNLIETFRWKY